MMQYLVIRDASGAADDGPWLLLLSGKSLATFQTHEAACRAAVTLARLDLLSGQDAEVWVAGCGEHNQRVKLELDPSKSRRADDEQASAP
jgi:hypothetical protein